MNGIITPQQAFEWLKDGHAVLLDVREPDEFRAQHISYAQSLPLGCLSDAIDSMQMPEGRKIIVQCLSGRRGESACALLTGKNIRHEIYNIEGGITGWQAAGLPIVGGAAPKFTIFRQVQTIVGALILLMVLLGFWGLTLAFVVAGIFGGALLFAGLTGWCGLAMLLQRMPWNK